MAESDDTFVGRWSRRKRGARTRGEAAGSDQSGPVPAASPAGDAEPAETVAVEDLPDIDSLDEQSDFTVFLKEGVPEELRKRALRRLWRLNPVFANLDGLAEYDEDFTDAASLLEGVKTLYQVGKGMVAPEEPAGAEVAESDTVARADEPRADEPREDEPEAGAGGEASEPGQIGERAPAPESAAAAKATPVVESDAAASPVEPARPPRRRSAAQRRWHRFTG